MRATGTENAADADKVIQTTKAEVDGVNRIMAGVGVALTLPALGPGLQYGLAWWSADQFLTGVAEGTSGVKQNSVGGYGIQSAAGDGKVGKILTTVYDNAPPLIELAANLANGPSKPPADPTSWPTLRKRTWPVRRITSRVAIIKRPSITSRARSRTTPR